MIELTEEYKAVAKEFKKVFGYGVPLNMVPSVIEMSDLIKQIQICLETKNDVLLENLGIEDNSDKLF